MNQWNTNTEPTGSDVIQSIESLLTRSGKGLIFIVVLILAIIWMASGIYSVDQGEQAVIRQFGKHIAITGPGLRYRLPWPIQRHDIVNVATVRSSLVGFEVIGGSERTIPQEAMMLTGDENIVRVHMFVQYRIKDAAGFLFNVRDPEATLHTAAEAALRSVIGQNNVDHAMSADGRAEIQFDIREYLQDLLDLYGAGVAISQLRLLAVEPPDEVKNSFDNVVRALEDRSRQTQMAEAYREDLIPRARGEAQAIIREAEAYKESRVLTARGDVASFVQVLEEYEKAVDITRERLYLEAITDILKDTNKIIIDKEAGEGIMQFLPLTGISGSL